MNDSHVSHRDGPTRLLLWIALSGLGVGLLSLAVLVLTGNVHVASLPFGSTFACAGYTGPAEYSANERRWDWHGSDTVDIDLSDVIVHYGTGTGDQVVARGSRAALAHIEVGNSEITSSCNGFPWRKVHINLPATRFRHIGLGGPGEVEITAADQPELEVSISGPGVVQGQGNIHHVHVSVSGPGTVKFADLAMDSLDADIAGPGTVIAGPKSSAHISISGPGALRLLSRPPDLTTHIAGPSSITYATGGGEL